MKKTMVILVVMLIAIVVNSCLAAEEKASLQAVIEKYNFYSDPGLFQREDYKGGLLDKLFKVPSGKLGKLLSPDCKITFEIDGKPSVLTKSEFIEGIEKTRFMIMAQQVDMDTPKFEKKQDYFLVRMTKGFLSEKSIGVADCKIVLKEVNGNFLITEINRHYRNPTKMEVQKIEASIHRKPYTPKKGLGARYLGGGWFGSSFGFSRDGKKIVFASLRHESSEIYLMNNDGSDVKRLTNTPYWEIDPSFTPDGKNILLRSDQDNYEGEPYLLNLEDNSIRRLAPGYRSVKNVCYSPDANFMAFTAIANNKNEIYLMGKTGDNIRQITQTGLEKYSLVFSPDAKKIYFSQQWYDYKSRIVQMYSVNVDGTNLRQLTHTKGLMKRPFEANMKRLIDDNREKKQPLAITSDDTVIFLRKNDKSKDEIWSMKSDGNDVRYLTGREFDSGIYYVKTTPEKTKVLFTTWDKKPSCYQVFSIDLYNDSGVKQISQERKGIGEFSISPCGKYIAVLLSEDKKRGKGEIGIIPIDGGPAQVIGGNY